ncbi:MAG: hypothetical protein ACM3WS_02680 [Bacillota bacterium]
MIMLCLTRTMGALAFTCAMFPLAGCGSHDAAARMEPGSGYIAAPDGKLRSEHGAALEMDATLARQIELRHFNAYRNFHAMLGAPAGTRGSPRRDEAVTSPGEPDYFPCIEGTLVKRDD